MDKSVFRPFQRSQEVIHTHTGEMEGFVGIELEIHTKNLDIDCLRLPQLQYPLEQYGA